MKQKSMILFMVAIACGLVAMLGMQQALAKREVADVAMVSVLVAKTDIDAGSLLDETIVSWKEVPRESAPEGSVTEKEQWVERAPKTRLYRGGYVLQAQLSEKGAYGAAVQIPEGKRIVTVPVDATKTHSGMLKPGYRVDVQCTYQAFKKNSTQPIKKITTILQNVQVYATDNRQMGREAKDTGDVAAKNCSLIVSPAQAKVVLLSQEKGALHLVLRSPNDKTIDDGEAIDENQIDSKMAQLFGEVEEKEKEEPAKATKDSSDEFFKSYVERDDEPAKVAEKPLVPKNMWTVKIYAGDRVNAQQFELPTTQAETKNATSTTELGTDSKNWLRNLMGMMGQRVTYRSEATPAVQSK